MSILTVALTGGIATGKSVVAKLLEQRGCYVHHADQAARNLMRPRSPAWRKIVRRFGPRVLRSDQTIDRTLLGKIIFADPRQREFLNRLIHPLVLAQKKRIIRRLEKKGSHRLFVSEAALTIEAGYSGFFDRVIVVHCPEEIQVRRLQERDKISRAGALRRIRSQMPGAEKVKHADYLIDSSGTIEETAAQTQHVYRRLLSDYRAKQRRLAQGRPG
ncbi:MAG: dephospho-CoA kinase [Acidobacteriota bacterium]